MKNKMTNKSIPNKELKLPSMINADKLTYSAIDVNFDLINFKLTSNNDPKTCSVEKIPVTKPDLNFKLRVVGYNSDSGLDKTTESIKVEIL